MDDILRQLDLDELIEAFEENGVGPREAVALTDAEFNALGVTRIGDRARIREKCRSNIAGEASTSSVVRKLREMVKGRRVAQPGPSKKTSSTLRVHIGWKHKDNAAKLHKQVIASKGGGVYNIDVARDAGIADFKKSVVNLFFPNGKNEVQNLKIEDLNYHLSTFNGLSLEPILGNGDPFTLEGYFDEVKTHPVRIYLVTDELQNDLDTDDGDSLPDISLTGNSNRNNSNRSSSTENRSHNMRHGGNRNSRINSNTGSSSSNSASSGDGVIPSASGMDTQRVQGENTVQPDTPTITFPRNSPDLDRAAGSVEIETIDLDETEEEMDDIIAAVQDRNQPVQPQPSERSCADIIAALSETAEEDTTTIVVQRRRILSSTVRAVNSSCGFSFSSPLQVIFAGEDAQDGGGPKREFFRLLLKELLNSSGMFQVRENKATFTYDINHLEQKGYKLAGQLTLWSLTHGGPGVAALCPSLFAAMVGQDVDMKDIDCLEHTARVNLEKLMSCTAQAVFSETLLDMGDWILEQGVTRIHSVTFAQRDSLVKRLFTNCIYHRVHSAVRQFTEGLGPLWEQVTQNPAEMKALFIYDPKAFTVSDFRKLYSIDLSPDGANSRLLEDDTVYCWELFLQTCSDTKSDVSLEDVLQFWTAARKVPPCGFDNKPKIEFYPRVSGIRRFPSSCTCWPILWLPRGIDDPDEFEDLMKTAIKGCQGFGKI